MARDLKNYAEVKDRIEEFVKDFPTGSIQTFIRFLEDPVVIIEARVYRTPDEVAQGVYTSGFAREVEGKSPVNKTSHVENGETSAIGRALANMGYSTNNERASRSEMVKVGRQEKEHGAMLDFIKGHLDSLTDEMMMLDGKEDILSFIDDNGKAIKDRMPVAHRVVTAMEKALGIQMN